MKYIIFKRIIINYIIMQSESVMYLVLFCIKINFLFLLSSFITLQIMVLGSVSRLLLSRGHACSPRAHLSLSSVTRGNIEVVTDDKGVATLSLNKAPVNSLNKEFLQALNASLAATSETAKGLVLTSSLNSVFCAGLEITEMHQPDPVRLREFWSSLQDVWIQLYSYKLPTAAAITGHR